MSPPGCGAGHGRYRSSPCPCWGVIASPIPFLSIPDISFPPIYWGGWVENAKQKHPPWTLLLLSSPVYLLPIFIFIYLFIYFFFFTKLKFYLLQSIPVITTKPAPSKCPNLLACSRSLCLFISSHDFAVSITLICPLDNSSLNISMRWFLREQ